LSTFHATVFCSGTGFAAWQMELVARKSCISAYYILKC
jgi:hypothetical protein